MIFSMTPQEIFEHKLKWKNKNIVKIHEDWLAEGKDWCKKNLGLHEWAVEGNVEPYYCHFSFEHKQDADNFLIFSKFFK